MANEERTGILHFEIDQKDSFTKLETLKKLIIQNKQEQDALKKAFKEGSITIQEYSRESVRLETILKKNQSEYGQLQKSVTGVKTSLDKLIDSNQKISKDLQKTSKSFQDVAGNINIAGTNVGSLTTKIASFANPATAAVGIVTALAGAYARSTLGAKDLEFAQNQLSAATTLVTNSFAELISTGKDGEGIFSTIVSAILFKLSPALAIEAKVLAQMQEDAEDLQRKEIEIRGTVSDRLAENQEKLTQIADEQTKYNEKLQLSNEIVENLKSNQTDLKGVLTEQLGIIKSQLGFDKDNESLLTLKLQKEREINKLVADTEKRIQGQVRATQNLIEAQRKQTGEDFTALAAQGRAGAIDTGTTGTPDATTDPLKGEADKRVDVATSLNRALITLDNQRTQAAIKNAGERQRANEASDQAQLQSATIVSGALAGLAAEGSAIQKGLTLTSIAFDTAAALTGGIKASQSIPYPGNLVAMATTIATILGNIAAAKQALTGSGFSEGGYTGDGPKYKPAGVVHAGEVVWSQADVAKAGGAEVVNRMRPTYRPAMKNSGSYADGGLVTNVSTNAINQQMIIANALKNLPPPVVGIVELNRVQKRVDIKQSTAKIGGRRNA